jgi:hypothetical protein
MLWFPPVQTCLHPSRHACVQHIWLFTCLRGRWCYFFGYYPQAEAERAALQQKVSKQGYQIDILKESVRAADRELLASLKADGSDKAALLQKHAHRMSPAGVTA